MRKTLNCRVFRCQCEKWGDFSISFLILRGVSIPFVHPHFTHWLSDSSHIVQVMQPKISSASQSIYGVTTISPALFRFHNRKKVLGPRGTSRHVLWVLVFPNDKSTAGFHVVWGGGFCDLSRRKIMLLKSCGGAPDMWPFWAPSLWGANAGCLTHASWDVGKQMASFQLTSPNCIFGTAFGIHNDILQPH